MLNLILRTLLALIFVFTASAYGQNEIFYNDLKIGREQESDISIEANIGRVNNPQFRYNATLSEWEFSDDGVAFISLKDLLVDISGKADIDSPSFTGVPTAPTPTNGDDSTKIATTEFVQDAIASFGAGDVEGPALSTDSAIALYDGVTGKILKNSGVTISGTNDITAGSLWLGSTSQILSSTGTLSLGSSGVITRALGQFNAYGVVTSNITTDSTSTGEDAVVPTPTTKVLRLANVSLESIFGIGAGLNSQELVLINSTGSEIFLNTGGNISSPDGRATKLNNGSITSLLYDNTSSKWTISSGSGGGGISKWTSGTAYFIDDVVVYSDSTYQAVTNSSDVVFDPLKWELLSFDTQISNETESFKVQNIEARRVVKTEDSSALIEPDQLNLLLNGSFEHQVATTGWTTTSLATSNQSITSVLDGKKKVCLSGPGSFYQLLTDTDKFHGRKFIARFNIQNPDGRTAQACLYDGEDLHKCIDIVQSTEFREYAIQDTFIEGKTFGVIITGNELDGICTDMNSVKLDANEAFEAVISNDTDWVAYTPVVTVYSGTMTNYTATGIYRRQGDSAEIQARIDFTGPVGTWEGIRIALPSGLEQDVTKLINATNGIGTAAIGGIPYLLISDASSGTISVNPIGNDTHSGTVPSKGYVISNSFPAAFSSGSYIRISRTVPIKGWSSRSQVINYPDETFSTDVNPVYWKATECGEDEIGCYNTYWYDTASNLPYLCVGTSGKGRPTQTDAAMMTEGVKIFTRVYANPSSCAEPARLVFRLPKKLSSPSLTLYKDTSKTAIGVLDHGIQDQYQWGLYGKWYDSKSGSLIIDSGYAAAEAVTTSNRFGFSDLSSQTNGYLVIKASKTGASLVDERDKVKSSADNVRVESCRINNNGTASIDTASGLCESWIQSVSRTHAGTIVVYFKSGIFSSPPVCVVPGMADGEGTYFGFASAPLLTYISILMRNSSGAAIDKAVTIICMGKR